MLTCFTDLMSHAQFHLQGLFASLLLPCPFTQTSPNLQKKNSCSFMNMHVVATVGVVLDPLVFKFQDLPLSLCL